MHNLASGSPHIIILYDLPNTDIVPRMSLQHSALQDNLASGHLNTRQMAWHAPLLRHCDMLHLPWHLSLLHGSIILHHTPDQTTGTAEDECPSMPADNGPPASASAYHASGHASASILT